MNVIPSKHFEKALERLPHKLRAHIAERLRLLIEDPFNSLLNNHALHGPLRHYRSINITGDYRLIYELYDEKTARLIDIGTHAEIYGR